MILAVYIFVFNDSIFELNLNEINKPIKSFARSNYLFYGTFISHINL